MMSRPLATVAAVALCLAAPIPAFAAAKKLPPKSCNIVLDPADDAGPANSAAGAPTSDPSLDIVYADLGADATRLTAVWRVKDLTPDPTLSATGRRWLMTFNVGPKAVGLAVTVTPEGTYFPADATGIVDTTHNEIRLTVPLKKINAATIRKGDLLQKFAVHSEAGLGFDRTWGLGDMMAYPLVSPGDNGSSTKTYVVGNPSCVAIGK
jgi:hypothetical protein